MATTEQRVLYPRPVWQSPALEGPVLLRDGRPAYLRPVREEDRQRVVELLDRTSDRSLIYRFFGATARSEEAADLLMRKTWKNQESGRFGGLTLALTVGERDEERIVAIASAVPDGQAEAEVAFLVEDGFQGKGAGTLLLERIAFGAEVAGVDRLTATVLSDNQKMLRVFKECGFEMERRFEHGEVEISLDINPTAESTEKAELHDKHAAQASIRPFFQNYAIAVVGASEKTASIGGRVLKNLIDFGYTGYLYPINPKGGKIQGQEAFKSLAEVPREVDLAVIAVPTPAVMGVVDECAAKGVKALIVLTAGFAETGPEGRELQAELLDKVRGNGMRMVGPNCLGVLNTEPDFCMNATFTPRQPPVGHIAMSSQSGALGLAILECANDFGLGFSSFVSVGNKADVSGNDLLQYWEDDPNTDLILLYLESFGNPRRFARIARRVGRKKPILAVKSGRSKAGRRAAGSHTAALAASDAGVEALFRQTGVIRTDTIEEMFEAASFLAHQPLPQGDRLGIVTNAGGLAILCADAAEGYGLELPQLKEETVAKLREFLPPAAGVGNPVDMIASATPTDYERAIPLALDDPNVDAVIAIYIDAGAGTTEEVEAAIRRGRAKARTGCTKPLLASFMRSGRHAETEGVAAEGCEGQEEVIPVYRFPESAARGLGRAREYSRWLSKPRGVIPWQEGIDTEAAYESCAKALKERGDGWLLPDEIEEVLRAVGIRTVRTEMCRTADEAVQAAGRIGYPVVVKLASKTLVHKSEWDGVFVGVRDEAAVRAAWDSMKKRLEAAGRGNEMDGVTVQEMAGEGVEVMLGVTQDPSFGPLVAFGLGGVTVELLGDVIFRITPLTDLDAIEMVTGIRGAKILDEFRGRPEMDKEAVVEMLLRISRLAEDVPLITEMDFNPVRVFQRGAGATVLDARIKVQAEKPAAVREGASERVPSRVRAGE